MATSRQADQWRAKITDDNRRTAEFGQWVRMFGIMFAALLLADLLGLPQQAAGLTAFLVVISWSRRDTQTRS